MIKWFRTGSAHVVYNYEVVIQYRQDLLPLLDDVVDNFFRRQVLKSVTRLDPGVIILRPLTGSGSYGVTPSFVTQANKKEREKD